MIIFGISNVFSIEVCIELSQCNFNKFLELHQHTMQQKYFFNIDSNFGSNMFGNTKFPLNFCNDYEMFTQIRNIL